MTKKPKTPLPHSTICFDCAKKIGGKAEGAFTVSMSICPYCKQEKGTSTITDYHWPKEYNVRYIWD